MWYASPGNQGWKSASRPSVLDADVTASAPNVLKPSAGRVIRIINNLDHNVQVSAIIFLSAPNFSVAYSLRQHSVEFHVSKLNCARVFVMHSSYTLKL